MLQLKRKVNSRMRKDIRKKLKQESSVWIGVLVEYKEITLISFGILIVFLCGVGVDAMSIHCGFLGVHLFFKILLSPQFRILL